MRTDSAPRRRCRAGARGRARRAGASERNGSRAAVAAGELAVLEGADDDVVEARGSQPVGARRSGPGPRPARARHGPELAEIAARAPPGGGRLAKLGQLGEGACRSRPPPQLEPVAPPGQRTVAARSGREAIGGELGRLGRQRPVAPRATSQPDRSRGAAPRQQPERRSASRIRPRRTRRSSQSTTPGGSSARPAAGSGARRARADAEIGLEHRDQRAADRGRCDRHLGLERDRDPVGLEHRREQRRRAATGRGGRSRSRPGRCRGEQA